MSKSLDFCKATAQKYWKRYSNKQVRRHVGRLSDGGQYKRLFDYAWEVD